MVRTFATSATRMLTLGMAQVKRKSERFIRGRGLKLLDGGWTMDTSEQARAVANLRDYAHKVVNWNFQGDWAKGYQEAMKYVLECLEEN